MITHNQPTDFASEQEVRWCPGCGDYAILAQVKKMLSDMPLLREEHVFLSGIGCASRMPNYLSTYGFRGLHGGRFLRVWGLSLPNPISPFGLYWAMEKGLAQQPSTFCMPADAMSMSKFFSSTMKSAASPVGRNLQPPDPVHSLLPALRALLIIHGTHAHSHLQQAQPSLHGRLMLMSIIWATFYSGPMPTRVLPLLKYFRTARSITISCSTTLQPNTIGRSI